MKRKTKHKKSKYDKELDLLKTRCRRMIQSHKKRAQKKGFGLNYDADDLINLAKLAVSRSNCPDCGHELTAKNFSIDHSCPFAKGGTADLSNLRVVCMRCNFLKGTLHLSEFRKLMKFLREQLEPESQKEIERRLIAGVKIWFSGCGR